jgi:hypothetical protein
MIITKEHLILFNTPMVQPIRREVDLETMTRRVAALGWLNNNGFTPAFVAEAENGLAPYAVGDLLWVRADFSDEENACYERRGGSCA